MDGNGKKPRGGKKPAQPAPATAEAATQQLAASAVLETPALSDDNAAAAQVDVGQPDVASVDEISHGAAVGGCGSEEEDDHDEEEQVERFYALLASIRATRGLPLHTVVASSSSCSGGHDADDTAWDSTRKKRLRRSAEPPWKAAFRMEDFEERPPPPPASSCKLSRRTDEGRGPRRPR